VRAATLRAHPGAPRSHELAESLRRSLDLALLSSLAFIALSVSEAAAPRAARAGAWLRAPGETYAKAALYVTRGSDQLGANGDIEPLFASPTIESGSYREIGGSFYLEHGVSRGLTLFTDAVLKTAELETNDRMAASDAGDVSFGLPAIRVGGRIPLARGLARHGVVTALEPSVTFPLRAVGRSSSASPEIGSPSAAFALSASVGASIPFLRGYAQASVGYRVREGNAPNERLADFELGWALPGPFLARVRYDGVSAVENPSGGRSVAGMPVPDTGNQDVCRVAPTIAVGRGGGGELSLTWRRVVAGRSTLRSGEWEFAYSFLGAFSPR